MNWLHFDVVRALLMGAIGAFCSGCFWFAGYTLGRLHELKRQKEFLATITEGEKLLLQRMQEERKLQLDEGEQRGLLSRGRR